MAEAQKMNLESMDIAQEKRERLKALFPEAFSEGAIDFDQLKRVLGEWVEPGKERFGLNWPGKAECMRIIQQPSVATLKPARDESVNFDDTENLFIEGDNLEVLKLLQKSYFGKVKMIYIDPPYNTGNEFIYPDKYSETLDTYLEYTGQKDNHGHKFSTNTDTAGRYHSNWLNMMYPRLYLAKNLLREDGVIFISIDDHEQANLKALCDQIFGEENFIAECTVISNPRGRQSDTYVANVHDKLVVYARSISDAAVNGMPLSEAQRAKFSLKDESGEYYRLLGLRQRGAASNREDRPDMFFPIYVDPTTKDISFDAIDGREAVYPRKSDGRDGRWMWGKAKCKADKNRLVARLIERRGEHDIFVKDYLNKGDGERTRKFKSLWDSNGYNNQVGTQEVKSLFGAEIMSFPKPRPLLEDICRMGLGGQSGTILDFFAGSSTTAHAVMQLNAEDGGNRKFLCVQLPEPCDEKSEAFRAGYKTIADIAKERIRLAAKKIKQEYPDYDGDLGFKVFQLAPSNFKLWEGNIEKIENLEQQLFNHIDHLDGASTPEDILYELLLKAGFPLTTPVEKITLAGKDVFSIEEGKVLICLDQHLTQEAIDAMADATPLQVICLDDGFEGNDQLKANAVQTFKARAHDEERKIVFRTV